MKVMSNYIVKHVLDNEIIIDVSGDSKSIIRLNETASFMFALLKDGISKEGLIEKMLENYEAEKELIEKDVDEFINKLEELKILEK